MQAEDRLYVSAGADIIHNKPTFDSKQEQEVAASTLGMSREQMLVGNKQWIIIPVRISSKYDTNIILNMKCLIGTEKKWFSFIFHLYRFIVKLCFYPYYYITV